MGFFRSRGVIITLVVLLILGLAGGSLAYFLSGSPSPAPASDEVIANLPEAESIWLGQPSSVRNEVCAGITAAPEQYAAQLRDSWLQGGVTDPALIDALLVTILDDCGRQ